MYRNNLYLHLLLVHIIMSIININKKILICMKYNVNISIQSIVTFTLEEFHLNIKVAFVE